MSWVISEERIKLNVATQCSYNSVAERRLLNLERLKFLLLDDLAFRGSYLPQLSILYKAEIGRIIMRTYSLEMMQEERHKRQN